MSKAKGSSIERLFGFFLLGKKTGWVERIASEYVETYPTIFASNQ